MPMAAQAEAKARSGRAAPVPVTAGAALMALCAVLVNVAVIRPNTHLTAEIVGWAVLLALAFWFVEMVPLHLEWAGQAYSNSLSEVPLVMGLFFCPSWTLVVARVIG